MACYPLGHPSLSNQAFLQAGSLPEHLGGCKSSRNGGWKMCCHGTCRIHFLWVRHLIIENFYIVSLILNISALIFPGRPTEIPEQDVYVCESIFDEARRQIKKMPRDTLKKFTHSSAVTEDEIYFFRRLINPPKVSIWPCLSESMLFQCDFSMSPFYILFFNLCTCGYQLHFCNRSTILSHNF